MGADTRLGFTNWKERPKDAEDSERMKKSIMRLLVLINLEGIHNPFVTPLHWNHAVDLIALG